MLPNTSAKNMVLNKIIYFMLRNPSAMIIF